MIIAGLDTESTGLDWEKHKIIEVCIQLYDLDSQKRIADWTKRIDPKRAIDAEALRVHGITGAELIGQDVEDVGAVVEGARGAHGWSPESSHEEGADTRIATRSTSRHRRMSPTIAFAPVGHQLSGTSSTKPGIKTETSGW